MAGKNWVLDETVRAQTLEEGSWSQQQTGVER